MSTPEIRTTTPTKLYAARRNLFKDKRTNEYSICVKGPNGRWRWLSTHTKDREEAVRRLVETGVDKVLEISEDERFRDKVVEVLTSGKVKTLAEVVREWLADAEQRVHNSSMGHYNVIGKQFLALFDPKTDIKSITPVRINAWINTAPTLTRRQRRMSILENLFTFAFDQGYRDDNPGKRLGLKLGDLSFEQMERKVKVEYTREEFDRFMACEDIQGFWRWAIQLSWWLGLRISDICHLQWGSFYAVPGKLVVWQKKTRRRVELDISDPIMGGGILTKIMEEVKADATDAVYCFPDAHQLYLKSPSALSQDFRLVCETAKLDPKKTFHSFRKSAAMRWQAAGRSIQEIGTMLGHEGTGNTPFYLETGNTKMSHVSAANT